VTASGVRNRRLRPQGLRPRLVLAFVLVGLVTGAAAVALAILAVLVYQRGWDFSGEGLHDARALSIMLILIVLSLLAVSVTIALLAAEQVLRPVRQLAGAAERMASGELAVPIPVGGADEMSQLVGTFIEMGSALSHNLDELSRKEAGARRFVADVSHELRTPLAAMTAVADLLDDEAYRLQGNAAVAARLVSRETRNLNRLVDDLIEISQFDAGTAVLLLDDVDVAANLQSCLERRGWSGRVSTEFPPALSPALAARLDPRRLDVIMANLIGNALRHGAPPVTVRLEMVVRDDRTWVTLEVADHGDGLPAESLPQVFDRFYKGDSARTRSEGSGLGLAIAAENARLHGGTITVANGPQGGAVFTLWLPVQPGSL
jgi:two-component system, OmpR family, sensor histidine kinase MtrB